MTVWANIDRTVPAIAGDLIAATDDRSPNGRDFEQANAALRWRLGRAPLEVRNRLPNNRMDGAQEGVLGTGGALADGWAITGIANSAVEVLSIAPKNGRPNTRIRLHGTPTGNINITTAPIATVAAAQGQAWVGSAWVQRVGGSLTNITALRWTTQTRTATTSVDTVSSADITDTDDARRTALIASAGAGTASVRTFFFAGWVSGAIDVTVDISAPQLEQASAPTALQITGANGLDITEQGVPSFAYMRPDLDDDVLPTELAGGDYDVFIAGRKGCWVEPAVTIGTGGTFAIGPTTFTGGPPGLLAAVGDLVACVPVDRTLTQMEIDRLHAYYASRGAGPMLEAI